MAWFRSEIMQPATVNPALEEAGSHPIERPRRARDILRRPRVTAEALLRAAGDAAPRFDPDVLATVEIDTKYEGYVRRELERAEKLRAQADFAIPEDTPFTSFATLSTEARQKLERVRPRSLAQAGRIPGVSPADLQNLVMEVRRVANRRAVAGAPTEAGDT